MTPPPSELCLVTGNRVNFVKKF